MKNRLCGIFQRKITSNNGERGKWEVIESVYYENDFLFAWLVDVNNYFFINPLSKPKGLPPDLSRDVVYYNKECLHKGFSLGENTFSWVLSGQIIFESLKFKTIKRCETISIQRYYEMFPEKKLFTPTTTFKDFCISYENSIHKDTTHVLLVEYFSVAREIKDFLMKIIELHYDYGEVRFVFGFN